MDYYSVLGVAKTASPDEIKKAYRKLAMEHHPDKGGDITKFQEINSAYETLGDATRRAAYDNPAPQFSSHPGGFSFDAGAFDLNDLFGQVFGRGGNPFAQQKPTYRTRVSISLVDAFTGKDHLLQLNTPDGLKTMTITVPPGIESGNQIRYENVIPNSTLIIEFHVLTDVRFERHRNDLYTTVDISVLDLIVGTNIEVNAINGKTLNVTIQPKTQPSQHIRIPGYGMPTGKGTFGDQIILIRPVIPDNISNDVIESIKRNQVN